MAKNTAISTNAALAACNAAVDRIDAGPSFGYVIVFGGTKPAGGPDASTAETALAFFLLPKPAFGNAADLGSTVRATANGVPLTDVSADNSGTATWFRVFDSDGTPLIDGTIGTSTSDMIVPTTTVVQGQPFRITSWTISMSKGG